MSVDLIESIERDERAMERVASALEVIADNLTTCVKLMAQRLEHEFPPKPAARDAVVTRIPSAEDALKEAQGASEEPLEEWIGLREQEVARKESRKKSRRQA